MLRRAAAVAALLGGVSAGHKCGPDDVGRVFSECFDLDGASVTQIVSYKKGECDGPLHLPAPKTKPCTQECADGHFYSAAAGGECEQCPAGTYSTSGSLTIDTWEEWPAGFVTYCLPQPCRTWQLPQAGGPSFITSGNQTAAGKNATSEAVMVTLSFTVEITQPTGNLWLEHRVESEWFYDGLAVFVDGVRAPGMNGSPFVASGVQYRWQTAEIPLSTGRHDVWLVYTKDRDQASPGGSNVGDDAAFIRQIKVFGTRRYVKHCTPCPPGKVSAKGSTGCQACGRQTKRGPHDAGDKCIPCNETSWAPPGSPVCINKQQCSELDYVPRYGACKVDQGELVRMRSWERANENCVATNPPARKEVPCGDCMLGFKRDPTGQCVSCPAGQVLLNGTCTTCQPGAVGVTALAYEGFDGLDGNLTRHGFSSTCAAHWDCRDNRQGNGWEVRQKKNEEGGDADYITVLSSGLGHGASVETDLKLLITTVTDGFVDFEYFFDQTQRDIELKEVTAQFSITDQPGQPIYKSDRAVEVVLQKEFSINKYGTLTPLLDPSTRGREGGYKLYANKTYELMWRFEKKNMLEEASINLRRLVITGTADGAAAECVSCPVGHKCPAGSALPVQCEAGTYQDGLGQRECKVCPDNQVSREVGAITCIECGKGTSANENHTSCNSDCLFPMEPYGTVDLRPIGSTLFGPILDQDDFRQKVSGESATNITRVSADTYGVQRYFLKLCQFVNDDEGDKTCPEKRWGVDIDDAFVCQRITASRAYSLGSRVEYVPFPGMNGLNISFTGGDACLGARNTRFPRSTVVTLQCAQKATEMRFVGETHTCRYEFAMDTPHACPVCTRESFEASLLPCEAGQRTTKQIWIKKDSHSFCTGGFTPEPVDKECTLGLEVGVNKVTVSALFVVCVLAAMSLCLCLTVRRNRALRHEYEILQRTGRADACDDDAHELAEAAVEEGVE